MTGVGSVWGSDFTLFTRKVGTFYRSAGSSFRHQYRAFFFIILKKCKVWPLILVDNNNFPKGCSSYAEFIT